VRSGPAQKEDCPFFMKRIFVKQRRERQINWKVLRKVVIYGIACVALYYIPAGLYWKIMISNAAAALIFCPIPFAR
jgi:hypothetical protein